MNIRERLEPLPPWLRFIAISAIALFAGLGLMILFLLFGLMLTV